MKRQHFLIIVFGAVLIASIVAGLFLSNQRQGEMRDLVLLEQGIKITAPEKDIERYIEAYRNGADSATLEVILNEIRSNPECQIKEIIPDESKEPLEVSQDISNREGVILSDGQTEFVIDVTIEGKSLIEEVFFTNTTEITVSMSDIKSGEEVDVYLYDAECMDAIVGVHRLSGMNRSITFSHLKSTVGYRICVEPINLLESKSIKITD